MTRNERSTARDPLIANANPPAGSAPRIDLRTLREQLRKQRRDTIYAMLDHALELLPPAKLAALVRRYLNVEGLLLAAPRPHPDSPQRLRQDVEEFAARTRSRHYFQPFDVNYKNCTEESNGTTLWIGDCGRLLDRCVALAGRRRGAADVLAAFEQMFVVIEMAANGEREVLFYADEGGLWMFGIDWGRVGKAWIECLGQAVAEGDREQRALGMVARCGGERGEVGEELAAAVRRSGMWG